MTAPLQVVKAQIDTSPGTERPISWLPAIHHTRLRRCRKVPLWAEMCDGVVRALPGWRRRVGRA